ncbi:Homeobox domain-containing protein [Psidium guajava]|nr:Homeobox domain-containing protein [Psidium guajava]
MANSIGPPLRLLGHPLRRNGHLLLFHNQDYRVVIAGNCARRWILLIIVLIARESRCPNVKPRTKAASYPESADAVGSETEGRISKAREIGKRTHERRAHAMLSTDSSSFQTTGR